jgi:hypothetical protein
VFIGVNAKKCGIGGKEALYAGVQSLLTAALSMDAFDVLVILEDDARPTPDSGQAWPGVVRSIMDSPASVFFLGYCPGLSRKKNVKFYGIPKNGTHLWAVKRDSIENVIAFLARTKPDHIDQVLLHSYRDHVAYSSLIMAGYSEHVTTCADPGDPAVSDNVRVGFEPHYSPDEWQDVTITLLKPAPSTALGPHFWVLGKEGTRLHCVKSVVLGPPRIVTCLCGKQLLSPVAGSSSMAEAASQSRPFSPTCFSRMPVQHRLTICSDHPQLVPPAQAEQRAKATAVT